MGETLELALKGAGGEPVDLWRTLDSHGFSELPPMRLAEPHVLEVTLPAGRGRPRLVRISGDRFGPALVDVSGPSASAAAVERILSNVGHVLRLDEDLSSFYAAASEDPDLAWAATGAGRMLRSATVFEDVVKTICTTNCAWSATERMVGGSRRASGRIRGPEDLRVALAEAFDDPTLEIVYGATSRAAGSTAAGVRRAAAARRVGPVPDRGRATVTSRSRRSCTTRRCATSSAFIDAATAYAVMTLDNDRLGAEAATLLAEVQDSRARIQPTADDERRRIERDLHDGAQQRLVALRIKIELAAERIDESDHASAELIRQLGTDVDGALDEVRSLARGIYPSPLADRGLVEGLRSAALQAALPTTVLATGVQDRYAREVESAAYFCCLEAVQNAAKHAEGAGAVVIELADNGALRFEVRDDGAGFDSQTVEPRDAGSPACTTGWRPSAATCAIVSAPGQGTRVIGRIPLATQPAGGAGANGRPPLPGRV